MPLTASADPGPVTKASDIDALLTLLLMFHFFHLIMDTYIYIPNSGYSSHGEVLDVIGILIAASSMPLASAGARSGFTAKLAFYWLE